MAHVKDPNRSGHILLVMYSNAILSYILAADMLESQTTVLNLRTPRNLKDKGWSNYLQLLPLGSIIFNIELLPSHGAKLTRAAGTSALLLKKATTLSDNVVIKLKSGSHRLVLNDLWRL